NACRRACSDEAVSVLSSGGRQTTSAPKRRLTSAISGSSVDTTVRVTKDAPRAASMVQPIRGLPHKGRTFLRGTPFDPPRAGMMATTSNKGHPSLAVQVGYRDR